MFVNPRALGCLFFAFPLLLFVAESSPCQSLPIFNITRGSSLSASPNKTSYWLSPLGNFAFGFYPPGNSKVGIWIAKSSNKALIWTAKLDSLQPVDNETSILFNDDGGFVLKSPDLLSQPLFDMVWQPAAYALMHDNGNFMLYSSDFQIVWQSFDHPTDTIVSGQILESYNSLVSANSMYQVRFSEKHLVLQIKDTTVRDIWISKSRPVALNLDATGRLYLVNSDGFVIQNLTEGEDRTTWSTVYIRSTIYRATVGPDGVFRLYGDRVIGNDMGASVELWCTHHNVSKYKYMWYFSIVLGLAGLCWWCCCPTVQEKEDPLTGYEATWAIVLLIACACLCRKDRK